MPGCGKSTVGRHLSRHLGLRYIDSDHEVEARIGMPIREYFAVHGEEAFRDVEQDVIEQLAGLDVGTAAQPGQTAPDAASAAAGIVIATGGGAVLRPSSRDALHSQTHVFYLRSTPEDLFRRLRHDTHRPLLQVADPLERLRELYGVRDPLYRRTAHYVVEAARPSVPALIGMVLMQLEVVGLIDAQQAASRNWPR